MSRWNLAWLLSIPAVAILGLTISYTAPSREKDKDYELIRLFVETLDKVERSYVKDLDDEAKRKLVEDMINGGLEHLDPHSSYMNPKEFKAFNTQSAGKFGGVGIQISVDQKTKQLLVISPMFGTPAYNAGVMAGDLIVKIDGRDTDSMRLDEAVDLIKGDPGEEVTLTVLHENSKEPVDLQVTRAIIKVPAIMGDLRKADNPEEWDYLIDKDHKIGYIRVLAFNDNTTKELKAALAQCKQEGLKGLIIDLRHNPGGQLRAAVNITNCFISEGRIVSTRGRNERERAFDAQPGGAVLVPAELFPLVVLVNRYSASASEIVAAALQDHDRAVIIGERTFGKGSVQNILELHGDQSALKLTTASYWRPNGKNIHRFPDSKDTDDWGVRPNKDFEVKLTDKERVDYIVYRRERDIIHGKDGTPPEKPKPGEKEPEGKEPEDKKPFVDKVLEKALDHLRSEIKK